MLYHSYEIPKWQEVLGMIAITSGYMNVMNCSREINLRQM